MEGDGGHLEQEAQQQEGRTLLFVSHDVGTVRALCERSVYLDQGLVRDMGPTPSVVDHFIRDLHADQFETGDEAAVPHQVMSPGQASVFSGNGFAGRCAAFERARQGEHYGTGEARIRLVELVDGDGRPVTLAEFDASVRVRIWVECFQPCTVSVNYKIRDRHLVPVAGADLLIASRDLVEMKAGASYMVEYATQLPLMDGDYSLRVSVTVPIARHHHATFVDVVELTNPFKVLPALRGRIYTHVYLPNSVSVETCGDGESR